AAATELFGLHREIHVLGDVAVQIEHAQRADALGKRARGIVIAAAPREARRGALRALPRCGRAQRVVLLLAVGPRDLTTLIVQVRHPRASLAERVLALGALQRARAAAFPLVRVTQAFTDRMAKILRLVRAHPDDRVLTFDVRKLVLVDADLGSARRLARAR